VERLANDSEGDERGAVFTRREVVDFMLDLAGYTPDRPLHAMRLLEPSFGGGEFLLAAVERLLTAFQAAGGVGDLSPCIRAVELHSNTFTTTKRDLEILLSRFGVPKPEATRLLNAWLVSGDYLLSPLPGQFDFVVGNPPYVRQELIPAALMLEYRKRYAGMTEVVNRHIHPRCAHTEQPGAEQPASPQRAPRRDIQHKQEQQRGRHNGQWKNGQRRKRQRQYDAGEQRQ
jgi:hypothetical protein